MKAHRSLRPDDVVRHGPSKIALMIASEFWRASNDSEYPSDVIACYERARELMGVLETVSFDDEVATDLQPLYVQCVHDELLKDDHLSSTYIQTFSVRLAEAFEQAAAQLSQKAPHA